MYEYKCEIKRVVDGDTVDVHIDLGFDIRTLKRIRIAGIDTPEVRGQEREHGLEVKLLVQDLLPAGTVTTINVDGRDKYGRWLGDLALPGFHDETLGSYLLKHGHAEVYDD